MRKALLFFLITAFSGLVYSQNEILRVEPANVVKEVLVDDLDEDYQDITTVTVTNDSRRTIQLVQRQLVAKKPNAWSYGTFSRRARTSPYVLAEAEQESGRPVRLAPGESANFVVVLQPDGISGMGTVEVLFSDLTFPGKTLAKGTFSTKIMRRPQVDASDPPATGSQAAAPSESRPVATTVRLYPNPARERFFVEAPPGTRLGRVEVSNALGNRLRKYDQPAGKAGYEIEDLPDGLYLITIYDKSGNKLKTLRLLHRRFGA